MNNKQIKNQKWSYLRNKKMRNILLYNELTHHLCRLDELISWSNGEDIQYNIPSPFSIEDIEIISNCIISEMTRKGNQSYITSDFQNATKKLLKKLESIKTRLSTFLDKGEKCSNERR